jgi:four helix bundle protein
MLPRQFPATSAEGNGRCTDKEFLLFLHHARGSVFEVETQLAIAGGLGYLTQADEQRIRTQAGEIARMLNGLIKAIKSDGGKLAA